MYYASLIKLFQERSGKEQIVISKVVTDTLL